MKEPFPNSNRRQFLKRSTHGAAAIAGTAALAKAHTQAMPIGGPVKPVSPVVVETVRNDMTSVARKALSNALAASDVAALHSSWKIFAGQLEETGAIPQIKHVFESSGALDTPPAKTDFLKLRTQLGTKLKIQVSDAQFESFHVSYQQHWPELRRMASTSAEIASVHTKITSGLALWVEKLQNDKQIGRSGRLVPAELNWEFCAWAAGVSLYLSTWGWMGVLGFEVFTGGTATVLLAAFGLALAIMGMFCL